MKTLLSAAALLLAGSPSAVVARNASTSATIRYHRIVPDVEMHILDAGHVGLEEATAE